MMEEEIVIASNRPIPPAPPPPPCRATGKQFNTHRPNFARVRVHFAVNSADFALMQTLIQQGIDLNYVTLDGNTPLTLAILKEQFDMAQVLVHGGADVSRPEKTPWRRQPIHLAARVGHLGLLENLIAHGASVHAADGTGLTPLHWAAYCGHLELIEPLLDAGAHLNVRDDRGRTPLFRASENGHVHVVKCLYENGAAVNIRDNYGWIPIFQGLVCGDVDLVTSLLDCDVDLRAVDVKGDTPVHVTVNRLDKGNMNIVSCTDVNIYMRDLNVATKSVQNAINTIGVDSTLLLLLLDFGARPGGLNTKNKSPFRLAAESGNVEVMKLLVSAGAELHREQWLHDRLWPSSVADNEEICQWLDQIAGTDVPALVQLSRLAIRRSLHKRISSKINQLPLPLKLKQYLEL